MFASPAFLPSATYSMACFESASASGALIPPPPIPTFASQAFLPSATYSMACFESASASGALIPPPPPPPVVASPRLMFAQPASVPAPPPASYSLSSATSKPSDDFSVQENAINMSQCKRLVQKALNRNNFS